MTALDPHAQRPLRRLTAARYRRRGLVVELSAHSLTIREQGRRKGVAVPYDAIYELGFKLQARAAAAEKAARKKAGMAK